MSSRPDVHIVDMRSDTMTKPTDAMRQAMADAAVGDDQLGEDPTVNVLQDEMASMFGMEAAIFVPTGTMGNCISVLAHCQTRGREIIVGDKCHIYNYEQGGVSQLGGVLTRSVRNLEGGVFDLDEVRAAICDGLDPHQSRTQVICIENTHNECGGTVLPLDFLKKLRALADEHGLLLHMDGARALNAAVSLDWSLAELLRHVDSVSLCFSKGLGAPVGSVVGGTKDFIRRCFRLRKALGGNMCQSGVLAAACRVALLDARTRLQRDHLHARKLATALHDHSEGLVHVDLRLVHTNIILVHLTGTLTPEVLINRLEQVPEQEIQELQTCTVVKVTKFGPRLLRLTTHSDLSDQDIDRAIHKIIYILKEIA